MKRFLYLALPLIVGIILSRFRDIVENQVSSSQTGLFSSLRYGKKLVQAPISIVPYALGIAMFPYLCSLAVKKSYAEFGRIVFYAIRLLALFLLPLTALIAILRVPVIQVVYQRLGSWDQMDVSITATLLGLYVLALVFYAIETVIMQSFFAIQNTIFPIALGLFSSFLHIGFIYMGIYFLDWPVLIVIGLAFPLSRALKNILLILFFNKKVPLKADDQDPWFIYKLTLVTVLVACVAYFTYQFIDPRIALPTKGNLKFELIKLVRLGIPFALATLIGFALMPLLKIREFSMVVDFIKNKGWKK